MRVVLSAGGESLAGGLGLAESLAGSDGEVRYLRTGGVPNLRRRLSQAEVHALRKALTGAGPAKPPTPPSGREGRVVGLVCSGARVPGGPLRGRGLETQARDTPGLVAFAVADHVGLGLPSPLMGPNDDTLGPRFPVMAGIYRPGLIFGAAEEASEFLEHVGIRVAAEPVVAAGVKDDSRLAPFESAVVQAHALPVVSGELVPVAIVAAHLGFRVAAVVLTAGECTVAGEAAELVAALMGPERRG